MVTKNTVEIFTKDYQKSINFVLDYSAEWFSDRSSESLEKLIYDYFFTATEGELRPYFITLMLSNEITISPLVSFPPSSLGKLLSKESGLIMVISTSVIGYTLNMISDYFNGKSTTIPKKEEFIDEIKKMANTFQHWNI